MPKPIYKRTFIRRKKKGEKAVKNKDFNRKVSTALNKLAETKHHDAYIADVVVNTLLPVQQMLISQGLTDTGRVGDFFRLTSIQLMYSLKANDGATAAQDVRIIIFQWYNETAPTAANVLQNTGFPSNFVSNYSYDRIRGHNDMRVLYDKYHIMNDNLAGESGFTVSRYLRNYRKKIYFTSAGATPTNGNVYVMAFSNTATAAQVPFLNLSLRFLYVDY